jgi:hypothetical protein
MATNTIVDLKERDRMTLDHTSVFRASGDANTTEYFPFFMPADKYNNKLTSKALHTNEHYVYSTLQLIDNRPLTTCHLNS